MNGGTTIGSAQRGILRYLPGLLAALLVLLAAATQVLAHAALISASPADGAVVTSAPGRFTLTFSEPVSPLVLTLIEPDGVSTKLDQFALRDNALEVDAPAGLSKGTHVINWRVVSEDGHPVAGSVIFSIGAPSAAPPVATAEAVNWTVRAGLWAGRVALYLGLFIGIGGVFASYWLAGAAKVTDGLSLPLLVLGLAATILSVGFQGLDALGAPIGSLFDGAVWQAGFGTSLGSTAIIAAMSFGVALLAVAIGGGGGLALSLLALLCTGAALAASGHASAAAPQWLTRPMVFIHGIGIAFWVGALLPLAWALRCGAPEAQPMLLRFSRTIPYVLALLAIAGSVLAFIQLGRPSALFDTAYGRVFLVKLALLALIFGLAVVNRFRLTGPVERGEPGAAQRLARSISVETAVIVLVFAVAAIWRFTPPPRALDIAAAEPVAIHIHTDKAMADVSVRPGRTGPVEAAIIVMTVDFGPLAAKEVTLVLSNPAAGIERIRRQATKADDGTWRVSDLVIPISGTWIAQVVILVSDFEMVRLDGEIRIRP